MIEYPFPDDPSLTRYCLFPAALEDDDQVFFHATPAINFGAICQGGFKLPTHSGPHSVVSVSFAKSSQMCLTHAINKRKTHPGDYYVFAVRYQDLGRGGLKINLSDMHDYTLDPQPDRIGFCMIPASYDHR